MRPEGWWVAMIADRAKDASSLTSPWTLPAQSADSDDEEENDVGRTPSTGLVDIPSAYTPAFEITLELTHHCSRHPVHIPFESVRYCK